MDTIHDKLICPRCASRDFVVSVNKVDVICKKCKTRIPIKNLRCSVELYIAPKPERDDIQKGYSSFMTMSVARQQRHNAELTQMRKMQKFVDIGNPRKTVAKAKKEAEKETFITL